MLQHYQQQVASGLLRYDENQWQVLQQLAALAQTIDDLDSNLQIKTTHGANVLKGLYIYGPVGRGKTMLLDLFYHQLASTKKIRLHFHHFMARVHQELHQLSGQPEPLRLIANNWARHYQVLCFAEFFVSDIGDAMLLGTLWRELFALGVLLVTTSNSPPSTLYANGLQRSRFLPAIALLEHYCQIYALDQGTDYRRLAEPVMRYYLQQTQSNQQPRPEPLTTLTGQLFGALHPRAYIRVMQRDIPCLWHNQRVIGFEFMALCSGPRSQLDYMELASTYRVIAVANVPQFTKVSDTAILHGVEENYQREQQDIFVSKLDNEARRFIALVDECYERRTLLLLSAEVAIAELYQASQLSFAFERTVSRLFEMQSWSTTAECLTPPNVLS